MKKIYPILLILTIFLLFPIITYADCTTEELNNFKKLEQEYKVTYKYDKTKQRYQILFTNPDPKTYGYTITHPQDANGMTTTVNIYEVQETTTEYSVGTYGTYEIKIIGLTNTCNETLKRTNLKISKYNPYSEDPLCDGIEEFVLCQETYDKDIDYDTFVSRVNTYKNQKAEAKSETNNGPKENKVLEYIEDNLLKIIIIVIFIVLVAVTTILTIQSSKKSRRLEWYIKTS